MHSIIVIALFGLLAIAHAQPSTGCFDADDSCPDDAAGGCDSAVKERCSHSCGLCGGRGGGSKGGKKGGNGSYGAPAPPPKEGGGGGGRRGGGGGGSDVEAPDTGCFDGSDDCPQRANGGDCDAATAEECSHSCGLCDANGKKSGGGGKGGKGGKKGGKPPPRPEEEDEESVTDKLVQMLAILQVLGEKAAAAA